MVPGLVIGYCIGSIGTAFMIYAGWAWKQNRKDRT